MTLGYKSSDDFARRVSDTGVGDSHNVLVYILLFGFTTFILSMFWPLIRLQYPCITIADLEAKEKKVYGLFQGAVKEGILVGQTMANMEMKQIELEFSDPDEKPRNGIVDVVHLSRLSSPVGPRAQCMVQRCRYPRKGDSIQNRI